MGHFVFVSVLSSVFSYLFTGKSSMIVCISKERWDLSSSHVSCLSQAWPHSTKDVHRGHRGFLPPPSFIHPLIRSQKDQNSQGSESLQAIAKDTLHIILQVDEGSKIWCAAWTSEPEPYFAWLGFGMVQVFFLDHRHTGRQVDRHRFIWCHFWGEPFGRVAMWGQMASLPTLRTLSKPSLSIARRHLCDFMCSALIKSRKPS